MATGSDWADFRREGCQATDHCSRQRFNICWHKDHWISLMRWWEIFHLRLWQGYQIILTRCQNNFRPHLCFKPKQIFLKPNTVFFVLKPNQTIKTHATNRKMQRKEWRTQETSDRFLTDPSVKHWEGRHQLVFNDLSSVTPLTGAPQRRRRTREAAEWQVWCHPNRCFA